MKYETLKASIELAGWDNILEAIEKSNTINETRNDYEKEFLTLFHGSMLKDKVNAVYLSTKFECVNYWEYAGEIDCYLDVDEFLQTNGGELDCLDECFWLLLSGNRSILDTALYNEYEWNMINEVLYNTDLNLDESDFCNAAEYLNDRCHFYSDFIDYSESDLLEYVKREKEA